MPPLPDKRRVLFDALAHKYNLGTFEQFSAKLDIPEKRKAFWDALSPKFNLGADYAEFEKKVNARSEPDKPAPAPPPEPEPGGDYSKGFLIDQVMPVKKERNAAESTATPVVPAIKKEKLYQQLPIMREKAIKQKTWDNLLKAGKIAPEGSPAFIAEKANVAKTIGDEEWMPKSILNGQSQADMKKSAIKDFAASNKEPEQYVQAKLDDGSYVLQDGKVKEKGDFFTNFAQGTKDFVNNVGLALNVAAAQSKHDTDAGAENEIKYVMKQYFNGKRYEREVAATDAAGTTGKFLSGLVPYMIPYADVPLMALSNVGANHSEIWGDPDMTESEKARAITRSSKDALMTGVVQGLAFRGAAAGNAELTPSMLLNQYAPSAVLKQKFAQRLYNSTVDILRTTPEDMKKAAGIFASTDLLNKMTQAREGVQVDFTSVPKAALEGAVLDLIMKGPKVVFNAYSVMQAAKKSGYRRANPDWYNKYDRQQQDVLNSLVSAPNELYEAAMKQLEGIPGADAGDVRQKISTFRNFYESLPSELSTSAKNKALHLLQLKTEALSDSRTVDPAVRAQYEGKAKAYDGLLQKVLSGERLDAKANPLLLPYFAAGGSKGSDPREPAPPAANVIPTDVAAADKAEAEQTTVPNGENDATAPATNTVVPANEGTANGQGAAETVPAGTTGTGPADAEPAATVLTEPGKPAAEPNQGGKEQESDTTGGEKGASSPADKSVLEKKQSDLAKAEKIIETTQKELAAEYDKLDKPTVAKEDFINERMKGKLKFADKLRKEIADLTPKEEKGPAEAEAETAPAEPNPAKPAAEAAESLPTVKDDTNNVPLLKDAETGHRYFIPESVARKAYENDKANNGTDGRKQQPFETIVRRGGYDAREMDALHPTWRAEVAEINSANKQSTPVEAGSQPEGAKGKGEYEKVATTLPELPTKDAEGKPIKIGESGLMEKIPDAKEPDEALTHHLSQLELTHVAGLSMGAHQGEGIYLSTESGGNRYDKGGTAVKKTADIKKPFVTHWNDLLELQHELLNEHKGEFNTLDFDNYEVPDGPLNYDQLSFEGSVKVGKMTSKFLKDKGYDSIYMPEDKTQEGQLIVFDRKMVKDVADPNEAKAKTSAAAAEGNDGKKQKEKGVFDKARHIEDINSPYDAVLKYFAEGGKILDSVVKKLYGDKKGKELQGEMNARIGLRNNKKGLTIDQIAQHLWQLYNHHGLEEDNRFTTMDYVGAIEDVLGSHTSPGSMAKELVRRYEGKLVEDSLSAAEKEQLAQDENKGLLDDLYSHVTNMDKDVQEEVVDALLPYQNEYGFIDWDRLKEDNSPNSFTPELLTLSEKAQKELHEIIEKNIPSRQGEPGNDAGKNDVSQTEPGKETIEQANVRQQLEAATSELTAAKTAYDAKKKDLDKGLVADQSDLFGDRKSNAGKNLLFDERASGEARDKALQPLKDRLDKARKEVERLQTKQQEVENAPTTHLSIDFDQPRQVTLTQPLEKGVAQDIADRIRNFADKVENLKLGDGAMSDITALPRWVMAKALKGAAAIIEGSGTVAKAINKFAEVVRDHYRENGQEYDNAELRKQAKELFRTNGLLAEPEKKLSGKQVMDSVKPPKSPKLTITEREGLNKQIRDMARGFREGLKDGILQGKNKRGAKADADIAALRAAQKERLEKQKAANQTSTAKAVDKATERGRREGEAQERAMQKLFYKQVSQLLKSTSFGGKLTEQQAKAIARKAASVGTSPVRMQKFIEYAAKVVEDVHYAENLIEAKRLQQQIKGLSKGSKVFANNVDLLDAVTRIPIGQLRPQHLDDLMGVMKAYKQAQLSPTDLNYQPFETATNMAKLEAIQKQLDIDADNATVAKAEELSGVLFLSPEEAQLMLHALAAADIDQFASNLAAAKQVRLADALRTWAAYSQIAVREALTAGNFQHMATEGVKMLKRIGDADISKIPTRDLGYMVKTIDNAIVNGSAANLGRLDAMLQSHTAVEALTDVTSKNKKFKLNTLQEAFEDLPVLMKAIYGLSKVVAAVRHHTGWDKVFDGGSIAKKKFLDKSKAFETYLKFHKISTEPEEVMRRGMYAHAVQHYGGTPEEINEAYNNNKKLIEQSIEAYAARESTKDMAKVLQKLYDADVKPFATLDDMMNHFATKYEKTVKAHKYFADTFAGIKDQLKFLTEAYQNEKFDGDTHNYTPRSYNFIDRQSQLDPTATSMRSSNNYVGKPKQNVNTIKRVVEKRLPPGMALDFNFDYAMQKQYKNMLYDIHTTEGRFQFSEFTKRQESAEILGGMDNKARIKDQFEKAEKMQAGQQQEADIAGKMLRDMTSGLRSLSTTYALGGVTQYLKQYPSVAAKTLLALGKDVKLYWNVMKVDPTRIPLLEQTSIIMRGEGQAGTRRAGREDISARKELTKSMFSNSLKWVQEKTGNARNAMMHSLEMGDTRVAQRSFLAYYLKFLKDNGEVVPVEHLYTEHVRLDDPLRQQALAYAQQMVDETQVSSNQAMFSDLKRSDGNAYKEMFKNVFLPFNSFASNTRARMIEDIKFISYGDKQQRREALSDLGSTAVETVVFNGISRLLIPALITIPAHKLLDYLFGESPTEKSFSEKMALEWKKFYSNTIKDLFVSGIGSGAENKFMEGINQAGWFWHKAANPTDETTKDDWLRKNAPVYVYDNPNPNVLDAVGSYGVFLNEAKGYGGDVKSAVVGTAYSDNSYTDRAETDDQKLTQTSEIEKVVPLTKDQQWFFFWQSMADLAAIGGLRDADMKRILDAKKREVIKDAGKEVKTDRDLYRQIKHRIRKAKQDAK